MQFVLLLVCRSYFAVFLSAVCVCFAVKVPKGYYDMGNFLEAKQEAKLNHILISKRLCFIFRAFVSFFLDTDR